MPAVKQQMLGPKINDLLDTFTFFLNQEKNKYISLAKGWMQSWDPTKGYTVYTSHMDTIHKI